MKTGIALTGEGVGAGGVWQAMCVLHLPELPLMAMDDTALPLLCRLLCQKYKISPARRKRMERGGAASVWELYRLARWLKRHEDARPLKPGALLFFFSGRDLPICAPGTDAFLRDKSCLCRSDSELLFRVMAASRKKEKRSEVRVWPLLASGAEKAVVIRLEGSEGQNPVAGVFWAECLKEKPDCAAEEVFAKLWQRRIEIYDALLF